MDDTADNGESGATEWMATAPQFDDFIRHSIFLCGECEGSRASEEELRIGSRVEVEAALPNEELDVAESKRGGIRRGIGVFARAK